LLAADALPTSIVIIGQIDGFIDKATVPPPVVSSMLPSSLSSTEKKTAHQQSAQLPQQKSPLSRLLSLADMEAATRASMPSKSYACKLRFGTHHSPLLAPAFCERLFF
jgi:hypothetical protein